LVIGLEGPSSICKIVEYKVLISFLDLVVCDRTIVDLLLDNGFFECVTAVVDEV
jgi:hypothetical protein